MIQESKEKSTATSRRRSVTLYLAILLAVAFLLLLLAFFMQRRNSENIIGNLQNSASNAELLNEIIDENRKLRAENNELINRVNELETTLENTDRQLSEYQKQTENLEANILIVQSDRDRLQVFSDSLYILHWVQSRIEEGNYEGASSLLARAYPSDKLLAALDEFDNAGAPEFKLVPYYQDLVNQLLDNGYLVQDENGILSMNDDVLKLTD